MKKNTPQYFKKTKILKGKIFFWIREMHNFLQIKKNGRKIKLKSLFIVENLQNARVVYLNTLADFNNIN